MTETTGSTGAELAEVTVELDDDGVAVVEFVRGRANYFDADLIRDIAEAYARLDEEPRARAIVLCAGGENFCAGMDFGSGADIVPTVSEIYGHARALFTSRLPVVAALQGASIGGGLGLAMTADFRVGGPDTWLSANFATLGIHHGFGLTATLRRTVGVHVASEMLLTAERIGAARALKLGLLDRLGDESSTTRETALAWARQIATGAPLAVASIRDTLRGPGLAEEVDAALDHELNEQRALFATDDFREGVEAARERRAPQFVRR